uniref:AAA+ ATPase domain-containing protein n=1 Tax=Panagrolaimus sp. ES5 TaxID=591445 RepID=A0AC34FM30_9BILA
MQGFVLSELDQLITTSNQLRILSQQESITTEIIEKAVDIRNKSFSTAIGAPKIPSVKWSDVGGLEDVKKAISESLKANLKINSNSNLKRSGIVLYGPPGCGKTLIAKAVANEFNITFLSVKGPELLNQYVGQSEQNLRMIFEKARLASPSIIFFDEMDSLAPNRGNAGDSGGVMDRMVSQLLTELDTLHSKQNCNVFVMAATNRPDLLDPCLLTPGRFDKSIHVRPAQDLTSKLRILEPVCQKMTLENGLTPEIIAKKCPKILSGADITSLMQKAAMKALAEVIYLIEERQLKGDEEREAIEMMQVIVKMEHVEDALKDAKKCPKIMSGADITSLMQKAAMKALADVIYLIEERHLKGDEEREAIEKMQVIVKMEHVEDALKDFTCSLSNQDIAKYQTMEQEL